MTREEAIAIMRRYDVIVRSPGCTVDSKDCAAIINAIKLSGVDIADKWLHSVASVTIDDILTAEIIKED